MHYAYAIVIYMHMQMLMCHGAILYCCYAAALWLYSSILPIVRVMNFKFLSLEFHFMHGKQ